MKLSTALNRHFSFSLIILIVIICSCIVVFSTHSIKDTYLRSLNSVVAIAVENTNAFLNRTFNEAKVISQSGVLEEYASWNNTNTDRISVIREMTNMSSNVQNYSFLSPDGTVLLSSNSSTIGSRLDEKSILRTAQEKGDFAAKVIMLDGKRDIVAEMPIFENDKLIAYLSIDIDYDYFLENIAQYTFGETGNTFIILPDYTFSTTAAEFLPSTMYSINDKSGISQAIVSPSALPPRTTNFTTSDKTQRYMSFAPIPLLNILIVSSIEKSEIYRLLLSIMIPVICLLVLLIVIFINYRIIIARRILHPLSLLSRSLYMTKRGDLRARYNYNVDDEFGNLSRMFNQTMANLQRVTESFRERESKNNIILETITDVVWEYDIKTKLITLSENWLKTVCFENIKIKSCYSIESFMFFFHFTYIDQFKQSIKDCSESLTPINMECRIKISDSDYAWIRISGSCVYNNFKEPYKIIGAFFNISDEKEREVVLLNSATRDDMTKLLKKGEFRRLVSKGLERPSYTHFVIMVDIDHFKDINDTYGHLVGDEVVVFVANTLRKLCDNSCYIARFGGDEFTIYTKDPFSRDQVTDISECILYELNKGYSTVSEKLIRIYCSIGISESSIDGNDYMTLMEKADKAIYHAKNTTKNCYVFYDDSLE